MKVDVSCVRLLWGSMTMFIRKSPVAARELGISYSRLISLLRSERLRPPQKDSSGDYLWTEQDLAAAREALAAAARRKETRR